MSRPTLVRHRPRASRIDDLGPTLIWVSPDTGLFQAGDLPMPPSTRLRRHGAMR
jgi:hypothetical protein